MREGVGSFVSMLEDSRSKSSTGQGRSKSHRPLNHWADKCMYAELLEMSADDPWSSTTSSDGLPEDLETGWVAVAPVPLGKRCIAICYQSIGVAGQGIYRPILSDLPDSQFLHQFRTLSFALGFWASLSWRDFHLPSQAIPSLIVSSILIGGTTVHNPHPLLRSSLIHSRNSSYP